MHHHHPAPRRIAAAVALACLAPAVFAQATAAPEPEAGKLQTITVTAERRAENILDVPSSISTLSTEMLDVLATGGQDLRVLAARVPSLNVESSFGRAFPRIYLRGYGNTDFRLNASQPVSLVYDDVVQENPILKGFPVFDLDRIEVLRGPQGTLFGRNTPAGVVKFESARPTKKFEGYGSLSFGKFTSINAEGALNVPTSADSALRVSLLSQNRDDWVTNTYAAGPTRKLEGYGDNAVRLQWLIQPSKDFSALFNVHGRDFDGSARVFRANIIKPGTNDLVDGFQWDKGSFDGVNGSELRNFGANARLRWDLGGVALNSITGYEHVNALSRGDIDGGYGAVFAPPSGPGFIPFSSETADGMPKHRQITQEFRLESTAPGPLGWQAGVYLFSEDYKIESFSYDSLTPGNPENGYERVRQKNTAYAVFGNVNYAVTPQFKLRGGLRYSRDKKEFNVEDYYSNVFGTLPTLADLQAAGPTSASPSDSKVDWDISGTYTVSPSVNLYARAATGYRGSSVQGAGSFNPQSVAGPESNTSFEAGVKAELFDRRARLSFGVFSYTVKDLQLTAVGGGANSVALINADKATGRGFELDLQAYLTDQLMATLGVGYNDTEIKQAGLAVAPCAACTVTDPINGEGRAVIDGNPLPQAPKASVNFTLKYTQPIGSGEFYVLTDWTHRSKINFFLYESKEFTGRSLTEGGLRAGYIWGNGQYEAAVFGRNITNQIRVVGGIDFNNLTGFINEPRTWGAQFRMTF